MSEAVAAAGISRLLSDERLTRRAVGGDERAFAAIFRRYHQSLYRFCLGILGNPEDAQDALQNTMIKVMRALPGEERKIDLKPWLYRIAHNESVDLLRRRRETRELDVEQIAPGHGLAEEAATRERLRRLLDDVRELPDRQREVLVMREISGLDFEEIGTALQTSGAVARQTLYEARQSLRQMGEGREMDCATVTRALSDGDGRVTRRRDVRAHVRSCAGCRAFRDEIKSRQHDFAALSPLPAVAAAGMLQGLIGGSQAGAGGGLAAALGGGAAKTVATSAAVKGVATVAVVAAVGVGAAERGGVIHLGLPGEDSSKSSEATPGAGGQGPAHTHSSDHGAAKGAGVSPGHAIEGKGAPRASEQAPPGAAAAPAAGTAPATAAGEKGHGHPQVESQGESQESPARPVEHPEGRGHETAHPPTAADGQEIAAEHVPEVPEPGAVEDEEGEDGGKPEPLIKPTHPDPPEQSPPPRSEPPAHPPGSAAPDLPAQAQPPAQAGKPAGSSAPGAGKAAEKQPQV